VHSLAHIHQTLFKFGPIFNYSTFNFESTIGTYSQIAIESHFLFQISNIKLVYQRIIQTTNINNT
jgi:hypothetical protein